MDSTGIHLSESTSVFAKPQLRSITRSQNTLDINYSDSSEDESNKNTILDSPRRGRSSNLSNISSIKSIRHRSKSRSSSANSERFSDEDHSSNNQSFGLSHSSSNLKDVASKVRDTRHSKRLQCSSDEDRLVQSPNNLRINSNERRSTLRGVKTKISRLKKSSILQTSETASVSNEENAGTSLGIQKSRIPPKRKRAKEKPSEELEQPDVVLQQNNRGALVAFDNSNGALKINPTTKKSRGFVSQAAVIPSNVWSVSQFLPPEQIIEVQNVEEIQPILNIVFIIIDNKIFKFDSQVSQAVQDISSPYYVLSGGEMIRVQDLSENSSVKYEELSQISMKMSSFSTIHGIYVGHKKTTEQRSRKINRKEFRETDISDSFYIYCKMCSKLKCCGGGSLTNFIRHLSERHDLTDPSKMNLGVMKIDDNGTILYENSERYNWDHARQIFGIDLLLQFMMDANLPFSNVEKFSLKRLLNFFDPRFTPPSRKTLAKLLTTKVESEVILKITDTLKDIESVALVVDAWSSRTMQGVLAVSVIFLDSNFQWKQKTLSVSRIAGSHTASNISEQIISCIKRWHLEGKIRYIVSDGGANMVRSLADLYDLALEGNHSITLPSSSTSDNDLERSLNTSVDNLQPQSPEERFESNHNGLDFPQNVTFRSDFCSEGDQNIAKEILQDCDLNKTIEYSHLPDFLFNENLKPGKCVAHTLQLVLSDGIKQNEKANKVNKIIKKIALFGRKRQITREISKAMAGRVLKRSCSTRWNSVVDSGWLLWEPDMYNLIGMLIDDARAKASKKHLERLPESLTEDFYEELEEFLKISQPVCKLTDKLQANGVTGHLVIPGIAETHSEIAKLGRMWHMEEYRQVILKSFETRMSDFVNDKEFIFATVLCPYYKLKFFELYFEDNPDENPLQMPSENFVKELCYTHLRTTAEMEPSFCREPSLESVLEIPCSYAQRLLQQENRKRQSNEKTKCDLSSYEEMPLSWERPEEFWSKNKSLLPRLFEKARDIFCKPATSGLVERLFSLIADINTLERVSLHVKTIEEIVMYKEFINIPKSYKEATKNVFEATDDQISALIEGLNLSSTSKANNKKLRSKTQKS